MNVEEIHAALSEQFGGAIVGLNTEAIDPWIEVRPDSIAEIGEFLRDDAALRFEYLNDLTAVDYFEPDEKKAKKFGHQPHLEVVYQLFSFEHHHRVTIKVVLERWQGGKEGQLPEVPSVAAVWSIADWHEREAYDLMGIRFTGHPNMRRILCPEDWEGHALRKDYEFPLEYHGIRGK